MWCVVWLVGWGFLFGWFWLRWFLVFCFCREGESSWIVVFWCRSGVFFLCFWSWFWKMFWMCFWLFCYLKRVWWIWLVVFVFWDCWLVGSEWGFMIECRRSWCVVICCIWVSCEWFGVVVEWGLGCCCVVRWCDLRLVVWWEYCCVFFERCWRIWWGFCWVRVECLVDCCG